MAQISKQVRRTRRKNQKKHAGKSNRNGKINGLSVGQQAMQDREMKRRRLHSKHTTTTESSSVQNKQAESTSIYSRRRSAFGLDGLTNLERMLGFTRVPGTPPWPGAQKVPHTCDEWY